MLLGLVVLVTLAGFMAAIAFARRLRENGGIRTGGSDPGFYSFSSDSGSDSGPHADSGGWVGSDCSSDAGDAGGCDGGGGGGGDGGGGD